MALVRELRSLQRWSPDNPETRAALQELVRHALEQLTPRFDAITKELSDSLERSAGRVETTLREAANAGAERARATEALLKAAESRSQAILKDTKDATDTLDKWLLAMKGELQKQLREPWYRRMLPGLLAACAAGATMLLTLTLVRPGWTLTAAQREALRVGESITRTYQAAGPAQQLLMRRANGWKAAPDSSNPKPTNPRPR